MADPIRIGSGSILLVPDAREFRRRAVEDLRRIQPPVTMAVSMTPQLERGFRANAQAKLDALRNFSMAVQLTPRLATGFRREAETQIAAALGGVDHRVQITPVIDTSRADRQMRDWRLAQEARPVRIRVETEQSAAGGLASLSDRAWRITPLIDTVRASRQLDDFADREISGSRARSKFTIRPDVAVPDIRNNPRIRQDLRRASYEFNDSFRLRIQPNIAGLQLRLPLGSLGLTAIPELLTQMGSLVGAIQQVSQAGLILPGVFSAAGASIATLAIGVSGISEAYKALSQEQQEQATTAGQVSREQVAAQNEVKTAVVDQTRARRDLSEAILNEQRRQRDLQLQLRGSKLSEAEAILDIQDAADKLRTGHFSNQREYDRSVLQYEEAQQNLLEVRNKNADLAQDVAKNEATGVANSDAVSNASQALTQSTQHLSEAVDRLNYGNQSLNSAAAKSKYMLDQLSPSAQNFVRQLIAMKPAINDFGNDIQENLLHGLPNGMLNLFNSPAIQQNLHTGMSTLAATFNQTVQSLMNNLSTPRTGSLIDRIFGNTNEAVARFNSGVLTPMINGLGQLAAAGTGVLPRLVDDMGNLATRFANFIDSSDKSGALDRWMNEGIDGLETMGRIAENLLGSINGISRAFGGSILTSVEHLTKRMSDFFNSAQGQHDLQDFIATTRQDMEQWIPILRNIPGMLMTAFETGRQAVQIFMPVLDLVTSALNNFPVPIEAVVTAFVAWKAISPMITGVQSTLNGLGMILTNFGTNFRPMRQEAAEATGAIDKAFSGLASEGGKIHGTAKAADTLAIALGSGGPLFAAITTVAMVGLDMYMQKQEEVTKTTQNLQAQTKELADTLDRVTGLATLQTRQKVAQGFADFKPANAQGLGGNVLGAADQLKIGGQGGADLVTAALPGGTQQYDQIMAGLRGQVRGSVHDTFGDANMRVLAGAGVDENTLVDAFLGVPDAVSKFNSAITKIQTGPAGRNLPALPNLGDVASKVRDVGGPGLNAALIGQALNQTRFGSGQAGAVATATNRAANPNVGLNPATGTGVFGPQASASAGDGTFKIVSDRPPSDPAIAGLIGSPQGGVTVEPNPPGSTPTPTWTYTLNKSAADQYLTGVPKYRTGGHVPKDGTAYLHGDEFVQRPEAVGTYGLPFMNALNEGRIDPTMIPHFDDGGPVPPNLPWTPPPMPDAGQHLPANGQAFLPGPAVTAPGSTPGPVALPPGGASIIPGAVSPATPSGGSVLPGTNVPTNVADPGAGPTITNPTGSVPNDPATGFPQTGFDPLKNLRPLLNTVFPGANAGQQGPGPTDANGVMANLPDKLKPENMAAKFGQILLHGVLGGLGISDSYLGDIDKIVGFGISQVGQSSSGYSDPGAQQAVEGNILAYTQDGQPIYYLPTGQAGTALPDASSTGTGGGVANNVATAPNGLVVGQNSASVASTFGGANTTYSPDFLLSHGVQPLYTRTTDAKGQSVANIPEWATQLGAAFGLTPTSHVDSTLHGGAGGSGDSSNPNAGWAFDFSGAPADEQRFADFIKTNLSQQTLQAIWQNPDTGQQLGIAGGQILGRDQYYTTKGGTYADHTNHVHWATDVPVVLNPQGAGAGQTPPPSTSGGWGKPGTTAAPSAGGSSTPSAGGSSTPSAPVPANAPNGPLVASAKQSVASLGSSAPTSTNQQDQAAADAAAAAQVVPPGWFNVNPAWADLMMLAPKNAPPMSGATPPSGWHWEQNDPHAPMWKGKRAWVLTPNTTQGPASTPAAPSSGLLGGGGSFDGPGVDISKSFAGGPGGGGRGLLFVPGKGIIGTLGTPFGGAMRPPATVAAAVGGPAPAGFDYHGHQDVAGAVWQAYTAAGLPTSEWGDFVNLENSEAGWQPGVRNPSSGAYGIAQFLGSGNVAKYLGGDANAPLPVQAAGMMQYLKDRPAYHGSPAAAWQFHLANNWYETGGHTPGPRSMPIPAVLHGNEFVHRADAVQKYGLPFMNAINEGRLDPTMIPHFETGGFVGSLFKQAAVQTLGQLPTPSPTPTPPHGFDDGKRAQTKQVPAPQRQAPPQPAPPPSPAVGPLPTPAPAQPTTGQEPGPAPQGPQPTAQPSIAPASQSGQTDHLLPAIRQGIMSGASALGNIAATAAQMGITAGTMGAGGPAGGAAGSLISGAFMQGGKIVAGAANVLASSLVGTVTPGTTDNPYGVSVRGVKAPDTLSGSDDRSTHYHGDIVTADLDGFFEGQRLRDAQSLQSQLNSKPRF